MSSDIDKAFVVVCSAGGHSVSGCDAAGDFGGDGAGDAAGDGSSDVAGD